MNYINVNLTITYHLFLLNIGWEQEVYLGTGIWVVFLSRGDIGYIWGQGVWWWLGYLWDCGYLQGVDGITGAVGTYRGG